MTSDFYCDEVLSGKTPVRVVKETEEVLAYHHTRPFWPVHIVVIPKRHVPSLTDHGGAPEGLLGELMEVVRSVAANDWSKSTPGICALPWTQRRALNVPSRLIL